ncbi:crosslink repair DNA glycosylase YcaQ family protein [Oerskovia sp. M15]
MSLLDRASGRAPRRLVEYWGHVASYLPGDLPSARVAPARLPHRGLGAISGVELSHSAVVAVVRGIVAERGPVTASEVHEILLADGMSDARTTTEWGWNWTLAKRALEFLFFTGEITAARRNAAFERCYDLTERVLPPAVLAAPPVSDEDAVRRLLEIGARAHGIGTLRCFRDYFRLKGPGPRRALDELVEDGVLRPVEVPGWDETTYLHRDAALPRRAQGRALLSPFDPLVFERKRLLQLFGTHYRIEIYVPAAQRVHGYYALPFLQGTASQPRRTSRPTAARACSACCRRTVRTTPTARRPRRSGPSSGSWRRGWVWGASSSGRPVTWPRRSPARSPGSPRRRPPAERRDGSRSPSLGGLSPQSETPPRSGALPCPGLAYDGLWCDPADYRTVVASHSPGPSGPGRDRYGSTACLRSSRRSCASARAGS